MRDADQTLGKTPARCAVITISDSRTPETDKGGDLVVSLLEAAGHVVDQRLLVRDDPATITDAGGTGIAPRDRTIEVLGPRLDRELPGFGELFRQLSFEEIGAAAMLSRALGGVIASTDLHEALTFALPGSPKAIELALSQLILPQLDHMRALLRPAT